MTLSAQLTAAQTQNTILQAEIERATLSISAMKAEVEVSRQKNKEADEMAAIKVKAAEDERDRRIREIEEELRAAETIRRKLHNQVQELKGEYKDGWTGEAADGQATSECLRVSDLRWVCLFSCGVIRR
jgi:kinesin family protein C1